MRSDRPKRPMSGKARFLFAAALIGAGWGVALCAPRAALASSALSIQSRVQQEFYEPLIPLSKNFKTCFKTDSSGAQVMSICTDAGPPSPASEPTLKPERDPAAAPSTADKQQSQAPQPRAGGRSGSK